MLHCEHSLKNQAPWFGSKLLFGNLLSLNSGLSGVRDFTSSVIFHEQTQSNQSKKISNDQELIQSDPISCPQNQKGNN